jgi:hypothetical protein
LSGWSSSLISKIWLTACRSGISKISILKDIYLENRFRYNKLEAILFEEMRRIDLRGVTANISEGLLHACISSYHVIGDVRCMLTYTVESIKKRPKKVLSYEVTGSYIVYIVTTCVLIDWPIAFS